jgi:pimeloyl-ACP methyl ester carboxylesterase
MREYPVFVPFGQDRLAALVTVPDDEPRGLVIMVTGGSAIRSYRFQVWTRAAEELAARGLASVRMDYRGIGDSTGTLPVWRIAEPPLDQVACVVRFAMKATGVSRLAVAGNCMGSRVALAFAAQTPACIGAVLIRTPILAPSGISLRLERARRWKISSHIRRNALLRRTLIGRLTKRKKRPSPQVVGQLTQALEHGHLLFLYAEEDFTFHERVRTELHRLLRQLPAGQRERLELRVRPGPGLAGLHSGGAQRLVIDTVVGWADERFRDTAGAEAANSLI